MLPRQGQVKAAHHHQPYYIKCYWDLSKKKNKIKNMQSRMINSQLATTEPQNKNKNNKLRKQLEQEWIHRHGDHIEGYQ